MFVALPVALREQDRPAVFRFSSCNCRQDLLAISAAVLRRSGVSLPVLSVQALTINEIRAMAISAEGRGLLKPARQVPVEVIHQDVLVLGSEPPT